ncbi:TadE family protein [Anoxynatronum sibiricum]|uniref:TadE family protein n=1 Tax=Anoxynatronum sibiricum TaxID=210623 RepID=A0ABU9VV13_9CLOT
MKRRRNGSMKGFQKENGQSLVELALILPIIVLLLFGTVEFGRVFYSYITVTSGVREGVRVAAIGKNDAEIEARIREAVTLAESDTRLQILSITPAEGSRPPGVPVTVEIRYNMPLITPLIGDYLPNPVPLTASATMRRE